MKASIVLSNFQSILKILNKNLQDLKWMENKYTESDQVLKCFQCRLVQAEKYCLVVANVLKKHLIPALSTEHFV